MATDVQLADYPLMSPKAELKLEKKSGRKPRSPRDSGPQKELVIPGIVDFERIRRALRTPKPQTPGTYCFGRLSHHSFFSRHHPHPQHVTHIQDLTGKPVCVVRDFPAPLPESTVFSGCQMGIPTISVPIGDPQSNRNPQLSSEAWKKELKELASRVAFLTKEDELKKKEDTTSLNWNCKSRRPQAPGLSGTDLGAAELGIKKEQKEEPLREQGAKYSAETGRLIPASTRAVGRRRSHQGQQSQSSSRHEGVQAFLLQDQELLSIPEENEDITFYKKRKTRVHWRSSSPPDAFKPEHREEDIEAEGRELRGPNTCTCLAQEQPQGFRGVSVSTTFTAVPDSLP
ncbi:protein TBATA isoform X15 [Homo sapiens]|uniref:protein TBATA isoform X15 n=1 Tax=Homo sapiens TaxID=9606 RepID=UPI0007DC82F8|nr:protein TBATA isoform X15 [Homo sapiens]XP_054221003.1 protein TBATA isoform X15 [Homo sapiens]|eukprot:XP_016871349.1 protein TBATA isoform X15 [Homo sapiens]